MPSLVGSEMCIRDRYEPKCRWESETLQQTERAVDEDRVSRREGSSAPLGRGIEPSKKNRGLVRQHAGDTQRRRHRQAAQAEQTATLGHSGDQAAIKNRNDSSGNNKTVENAVRPRQKRDEQTSMIAIAATKQKSPESIARNAESIAGWMKWMGPMTG